MSFEKEDSDCEHCLYVCLESVTSIASRSTCSTSDGRTVVILHGQWRSCQWRRGRQRCHLQRRTLHRPATWLDWLHGLLAVSVSSVLFLLNVFFFSSHFIYFHFNM